MKQFDYTTYKFFDRHGRRLAAFALEENGYLRIFMYTCSKKDQFSKVMIRNAAVLALNGEKLTSYQGKEINLHPLEFIIPIIDGKPGKTFIEYLRNNFWQKYPATVLVPQEILFMHKDAHRFVRKDELDRNNMFVGYTSKALI